MARNKRIGNLYVSLGLNATPFTRGMREANTKLGGMNKSLGSVQKSFTNLGRLFAAGAVAVGIRKVVAISDKYTELEGRLKLVTKSTTEFETATSSLYDIARKTRVEYASTVDLYTRFARSTEELNIPQRDLLQVTEAINKALIVSGASGESANAALVQLGQGMAAGALRGEELNSVMEQTPRLAQMIAEGLGVSIGKLREMGKEGKLTSEAVVNALLSQAEVIDSEFGDMEVTVSQAWTNLSTVFQSVINDSNKSAEGTRSVADAIQGIADTIEENKTEIIDTFVAIGDAVQYIIDKLSALSEFLIQNEGLTKVLFGGYIGGRIGSKFGPVGTAIGTVGGALAAEMHTYHTADAQGDRQRRLSEAMRQRHTEQHGFPVENMQFLEVNGQYVPVVMAPEITSTVPKLPPGGTDPEGDKQREQLEKRVEALRKSLMDERELLDDWYAEQLELVTEFYGKETDIRSEAGQLRIDLAKEYKERLAEIEGVTAMEQELENLQDNLKSRYEIEEEWRSERLAQLDRWLNEELITEEKYAEMKDRLDTEYARRQTEREKRIQDTILRMRYTAVQQGIGLLSLFAGKSKAAAIAAIVLNKGLMMAQTAQNTAAAVMRAMAELGPIAGPPAAAAIKTMGAVQMGLIAAAGLGEVLSTGGGNTSVGASSSFTTSNVDASSSTTTTTGVSTGGSAVQGNSITIYGINRDHFYSGDQIEAMVDGLNEYLADGGKIYFR